MIGKTFTGMALRITANNLRPLKNSLPILANARRITHPKSLDDTVNGIKRGTINNHF
jgi:hypothetical protein